MVETIFRRDLTDAGIYSFNSLSKHDSGNEKPRYYLDDSGLVGPEGYTLSPHSAEIIADLLDIAAAITWADRNCTRPRKYGNFMPLRGWIRQFELTIGLRRPEIWNASPIKEELIRLLTWLTEDIWILQFQKQQAARRQTDRQPGLFPSPATNALIVLYSGGLDSLAGTVALLHANPQQNVVLMSTLSDRLSGIVKEQVRQLQRIFGVDRIRYAPMPFSLVHDDKRSGEDSQRARGFLFLVFGIAEALACNATQVVTCENGIGLLNLPLNRHQLGAQNSRAVHPKTLVLMNSLLDHLGFHNVRCGAPHLLKTKADLCAATSLSDSSFLCRTTISCDSFPLRVPRPEGYPDAQLHCGWCTSCLFRRQALFAASLGDEDAKTPYQYDVCKRLSTRIASRLEHLKYLLDQRQMLQQACSTPLPEAALTIEFPELIPAYDAVAQFPGIFGLESSTNVGDGIARLFQKYVDEWQYFPFKIHTT